jgi:hypothetical protein
VSCPRNKHIFRCDKNGPPARREEGAYPERYVTDPAAAGREACLFRGQDTAQITLTLHRLGHGIADPERPTVLAA